MSKEELMKRALSIVERGKKLSHKQQWNVFWPCFESVEAYPKHYDIDYDIDLSIEFIDRPESVRNDIIEKGYFHYLEYYITDKIDTELSEVKDQLLSDEKWLKQMETENDLVLCQSVLFEIADRAGLTLCETHMVETTYRPCESCVEEWVHGHHPAWLACDGNHLWRYENEDCDCSVEQIQELIGDAQKFNSSLPHGKEAFPNCTKCGVSYNFDNYLREE